MPRETFPTKVAFAKHHSKTKPLTTADRRKYGADSEKLRIECNHCKAAYFTTWKTSASFMVRHLATKHDIHYLATSNDTATRAQEESTGEQKRRRRKRRRARNAEAADSATDDDDDDDEDSYGFGTEEEDDDDDEVSTTSSSSTSEEGEEDSSSSASSSSSSLPSFSLSSVASSSSASSVSDDNDRRRDGKDKKRKKKKKDQERRLKVKIMAELLAKKLLKKEEKKKKKQKAEKVEKKKQKQEEEEDEKKAVSKRGRPCKEEKKIAKKEKTGRACQREEEEKAHIEEVEEEPPKKARRKGDADDELAASASSAAATAGGMKIKAPINPNAPCPFLQPVTAVSTSQPSRCPTIPELHHLPHDQEEFWHQQARKKPVYFRNFALDRAQFFTPFLPKSPAYSEAKLFFCDFCAEHFIRQDEYQTHRAMCTVTPPGDEIYRFRSSRGPSGKNFSVFELHGGSEMSTPFCQRVSIWMKMYLDHKQTFVDVNSFWFYILCEHSVSPRGQFHIVGYFSKERDTRAVNNLACFCVLPPYQREGYGRFLIQLSYELSLREGRPGTPEEPITESGRRAYSAVWQDRVENAIISLVQKGFADRISIHMIVAETAMTVCDVVTTLLAQGRLVVNKKGETELCIGNVGNSSSTKSGNGNSKVDKEWPVFVPQLLRWVPGR